MAYLFSSSLFSKAVPRKTEAVRFSLRRKRASNGGKDPDGSLGGGATCAILDLSWSIAKDWLGVE